jgi:hypothetical protein
MEFVALSVGGMTIFAIKLITAYFLYIAVRNLDTLYNGLHLY